MDKSTFLQMVLDELNNLRDNATPEEKGKLNWDTFSPTSAGYCIYGQMTGSCVSDRAIQLQEKTFDDISKSDSDGKHVPFYSQTFNAGAFYTPLEKFLFMSNNPVNGRAKDTQQLLLSYIKGDIDELTLEQLDNMMYDE